MMYLRQRTGLLSFALFARSSQDDSFPAEYIDIDNVLERFLAFMFPTVSPMAFVQEFDLWASSRASGMQMRYLTVI